MLCKLSMAFGGDSQVVETPRYAFRRGVNIRNEDFDRVFKAYFRYWDYAGHDGCWREVDINAAVLATAETLGAASFAHGNMIVCPDDQPQVCWYIYQRDPNGSIGTARGWFSLQGEGKSWRYATEGEWRTLPIIITLADWRAVA